MAYSDYHGDAARYRWKIAGDLGVDLRIKRAGDDQVEAVALAAVIEVDGEPARGRFAFLPACEK